MPSAAPGIMVAGIRPAVGPAMRWRTATTSWMIRRGKISPAAVTGPVTTASSGVPDHADAREPRLRQSEKENGDGADAAQNQISGCMNAVGRRFRGRPQAGGALLSLPWIEDSGEGTARSAMHDRSRRNRRPLRRSDALTPRPDVEHRIAAFCVLHVVDPAQAASSFASQPLALAMDRGQRRLDVRLHLAAIAARHK